MQPRLLLIETSGKVGQVGLAEGERLLGTRSLDEARRHARDLAPAVADLLAVHQWKPGDVDAVLVSRGPGSYTGLRVGLMSAKAFAYAAGCRLLAIDTFPIIAQALAAPLLDVIADAQQDKVYVQRFPEGRLAIVPVSEWLVELTAEVCVSGPGLRVYRSRLPEGVAVAPENLWDPSMNGLLQLGLARYRAGEGDDVWSVEPLYHRPSSAEEKWQRLGKP